MKKIVLIGPVYPYKGGIAHYTSLMYQALSKEHDVTMISYKMQYPKLLFKKEQRDYSNDLFKIDNAEYLINTANPFNIMNVGKMIRRMKPDMVIFQWWHPYFAPCYRILEQSIGKKIKKLFICHNVFPHERFPMDRKLTKMVLKKADCYIVQSKADEEDLCSIIQNPVYRRTVHPTYNAFKFEDLSKEKARELLGIPQNEKTLLFFGFVREYKGLKNLIKAMPMIKEQLPDIKLMVVGDFGEDKQDYLDLMQECQVEDEIQIVDGYVPDREVEKYFAATDLVVLPYESATQSGIVQIAYGFEKPVVVTNVGGLPDVVEDGRTGYVVEAKSFGALSIAIIDFYKNNERTDFVAHIRKHAYEFCWEKMLKIVTEMI